MRARTLRTCSSSRRRSTWGSTSVRARSRCSGRRCSARLGAALATQGEHRASQRVLLFNTQISSLLSFKAQLADLSAEIVRASKLATQRITKAPYMAVPPDLLCDLNALSMPIEIRNLESLAAAARVGVIRRSGVWGDVQKSIHEAALSDDATLNPHRPWHDASVVGVLTRTQRWMGARGDEFRRICMEQETKQVVRAIRGPRDERRAALTPLLHRRMARWSDDATREVARIFATVDSSSPVELIATLLRTMLFGWCTSGRFNHPLRACRFYGEAGMDQQTHSVSCPVTARWMCQRMLYVYTPERPREHIFLGPDWSRRERGASGRRHAGRRPPRVRCLQAWSAWDARGSHGRTLEGRAPPPSGPLAFHWRAPGYARQDDRSLARRLLLVTVPSQEIRHTSFASVKPGISLGAETRLARVWDMSRWPCSLCPLHIRPRRLYSCMCKFSVVLPSSNLSQNCSTSFTSTGIYHPPYLSASVPYRSRSAGVCQVGPTP